VRAFTVSTAIVVCFVASASHAAISGLQQVATGLNLPVFATHAPGDRNRLFVLEKPGAIKIIDLNAGAVSGTFLTIPDVDQAPDDEGGLLGLAFHPDYNSTDVENPGRGKFYVYVTVDNALPEGTSPFSSHIREYSVIGDPATSNMANPTPTREILSFTQPQKNHNAGWIGFNPKTTPTTPQHLYIASGDGGGSHDNDGGHTAVTGNAQDTTNNLLGKMLRIDVSGDDFPADNARNYVIPPTNPFKAGVGDPSDDVGDDEIWAYGLRNPYRDSFDRLTGDLWIGDVGQGQREEIDFQPASSPGGENYGWRPREGTVTTDGGVGGPLLPSYTQPIYDYGRGSGPHQGQAVNGGYVYRGPDPDLQGRYFFSDSQIKNVWSLDPDAAISVPTNPANIDSQFGALFSSVNVITSFGEDADGNLYIVDYTTGGFPPVENVGEVYRILTDKLIPGDYNADGEVNDADYVAWQMAFGSNSTLADGNKDGIVDAGDYIVWRKHFGTSVHDMPGSGGDLVPEPATGAFAVQLLIVAALAIGRGRRGRKVVSAE
jgi:glucose/arabinose dehydrogenase